MGVITKTIGADTAAGGYTEAKVELRETGPGGLSDGFSLTGMHWEGPNGRERKRLGRDCDSAGQIRDELLRTFPHLEPFARVHLADPTGVPMHARANGWYLYSGASREYEERSGLGYHNREGLSDHDRAARALNIAPAELPDSLDSEGFEAFCDRLEAEVWPMQATRARRLFYRLVDGDGVEAVSDAPFGVTAEAVEVGTGPHESRRYEVTLTRGAESMVVPYGMGAALEGEPTAAMVLDSLARDTRALDEYDVDQWARAFDVDPGRAQEERDAIQANRDGLERLLGASVLDELLEQ